MQSNTLFQILIAIIVFVILISVTIVYWMREPKKRVRFNDNVIVVVYENN